MLLCANELARQLRVVLNRCGTSGKKYNFSLIFTVGIVHELSCFLCMHFDELSVRRSAVTCDSHDFKVTLPGFSLLPTLWEITNLLLHPWLQIGHTGTPEK